MNVVLISTYTYPVALGMRYVSAFLKQAGHKVTCLFMSAARDTLRPGRPPRTQGVSKAV